MLRFPLLRIWAIVYFETRLLVTQNGKSPRLSSSGSVKWMMPSFIGGQWSSEQSPLGWQLLFSLNGQNQST